MMSQRQLSSSTVSGWPDIFRVFFLVTPHTTYDIITGHQLPHNPWRSHRQSSESAINTVRFRDHSGRSSPAKMPSPPATHDSYSLDAMRTRNMRRKSVALSAVTMKRILGQFRVAPNGRFYDGNSVETTLRLYTRGRQEKCT